MAWFEELAGRNMTLAATVALAAALPAMFPKLRPALLPVVKGSAKIFLEAEWGADGDLADGLVDETISALGKILSQPAATAADQNRQRETAAAAVGKFKRHAHAHASRWGRNEADRSVRYGRRIAKLRRAVSRKQTQNSEPLWDDIAGLIAEEQARGGLAAG